MNTFFESFSQSDITQSQRVLHTPSKFAKSSLFFMQEAGNLKSLKSHKCYRENLNSFLFIIVLSGKGIVTVNDKVYALNALDCVLIDCKVPYSHQSSEDDQWELMWVHFNGPQAQSYYNYYLELCQGFIFNVESPNTIISVINKIMEHGHSNDSISEIITSKLITDILTTCFVESRKQAEYKDNSISKKLEAVRLFIDENFMTKITLEELAGQFFVSKFHLSREFKEMYGITIGSYLLLQRINHAKKLLRFSDMSIEAIAEECGIPDTSYFNKVFKKSENITASKYRKEWVQ